MITDYAVEKILAELDAEVPSEHWFEALEDGTSVIIRPVHAEDSFREFKFIQTMPSSARFRFLATCEHAGQTLLSRMMDIDYKERMAYVALVHQCGALKEIGVSRYAAIDGGKQCECAVVVAQNWQRKGLGVLLMKHLIQAAQRNQFKTMVSLDLTANQPMQKLAKRFHFAALPMTNAGEEGRFQLNLSA